jgi:hypothetical protein
VRYELNGKGIPSVTEIISQVLGNPFHYVDEWYLTRGRAVHKCAAMIAEGKEFKNDPRIDGQVAAIRKFLEAYQPEIIEIEEPKIHKVFRFAGTLDLLARIAGKKPRVIIDYKSSRSGTDEIQLGGYGELWNINLGMIVELGQDGNFKASKIIELKKYRREFLSCRSVYGIMERLGLLSQREESEESNGIETGL